MIKRLIRWLQREILKLDGTPERYNLDHQVAQFICPRLRLFVGMKHRYTPLHPTRRGNEDQHREPLTHREWDAILTEMLEGFEIICRQYNRPRTVITLLERKKIDSSLDLYRVWHSHLRI